MPGTIRLYSHNDNRIRSEFYNNKDHRNIIISRWFNYYESFAGFHFDKWYIRISPYIHEANVYKMDPVKFINKQKEVINNQGDEINIPDYVHMGPFKHETYFHRCYYAGVN